MRLTVVKLTVEQKVELAELREQARKLRDSVKLLHEAIESRILDFVTQAKTIALADIKNQSISECNDYIVVDTYGPKEQRKTKKRNDR